MSAILQADSPVSRRPWPAALAGLAFVLAGLGLLYWDTLVGMVTIWHRSETFAHAFLVLPISLWLVWRLRDDLRLLTPRAEPWVLLPMLAMAALWWLGDLVSVNAVTHFAVVALLVLAVPATLGFIVSRAILFPLLFLSGALYPAEQLPRPLALFASVNPVTHMVELVRRAFGQPAEYGAGRNVVVLVAWTVVAFLLATLLFDPEARLIGRPRSARAPGAS